MNTPNATSKRTVKVPRIQYRDFEVEVETRDGDDEGQIRLYPVSFSSEAPVRRYSWDTWEEYDEKNGRLRSMASFSSIPLG